MPDSRGLVLMTWTGEDKGSAACSARGRARGRHFIGGGEIDQAYFSKPLGHPNILICVK